MNIWSMLGIDPTGDKKQIKKAYAKQLKIFHPESDPEGYQKLRAAYDTAMRQANWQASLERELPSQPEQQQEQQAVVEEEPRQPEAAEPEPAELEVAEPEPVEPAAGQPEIIQAEPEQPVYYYPDPEPVQTAINLEERLRRMTAEARDLAGDSQRQNSSLAWAQLMQEYDDIVWDDVYRPRVEDALLDVLHAAPFEMGKDLWQLLDNCFGWSERFSSNREYYNGKYGDTFIDGFLSHYAEGNRQWADVQQPKTKQQETRSKASKRTRRIIYRLLITIIAIATGARGWGGLTGSSKQPSNLPAALPSFQPLPTIDIDSLGLDSNVYENSLIDLTPDAYEGSFDIEGGTAMDKSPLRGCGFMGYYRLEHASLQLPVMLQNQSWDSLYNYVDPYTLLDLMYTGNHVGNSPEDFFAEWMDYEWMEEGFYEDVVQNGQQLSHLSTTEDPEQGEATLTFGYGDGNTIDITLQQRGDVWLMQLGKPALGGELDDCWQYEKLNSTYFVQPAYKGESACIPLYLLKQGDTKLLCFALHSEEPIDGLELETDTSMGDYTVEMTPVIDKYDDVYIAYLTFTTDTQYITGIFGKTADGGRLPLKMEI